MYLLEWLLIGLLAYWGVVLTASVGSLLFYSRREIRWRKQVGETELPNALVILSLRGADPNLPATLESLLHQEYPRYHVRIVVDHLQDPTWELVQQVVSECNAPAGHVEVAVLESPRETCSLKCSALLQATRALPPNCEVVAFIDADTVPHATWLRDLVQHLTDRRVGATMGNRWYVPPDGRWGSWSRYLWNVGAVVAMYMTVVPWGGSLAVKTSLLAELRERWKRAGCDDVPLVAVLWKMKLKLKFVPSVLMVNHEGCSYEVCERFVSRQLLWVRLYHPISWWLCQPGVAAAPFVLATVVTLAVIEFTRQHVDQALWLSGALVAFVCVTLACGMALEMGARSWLQQRGESGAKLTWKVVPAFFLVQWLMVVATWKSLVTRQITWRGIKYSIRGPWKVHMEQYAPYISADQAPSADSLL